MSYLVYKSVITQIFVLTYSLNFAFLDVFWKINIRFNFTKNETCNFFHLADAIHFIFTVILSWYE